MAGWLLLGMASGLLLAHMANKKKGRFREFLINDFELHQEKGTSVEHFSKLIKYRDSWIRSISMIRKPFNNTVNMAIETAALIYACVALVNTFVHSADIFASPIQSVTVLILIGIVLAFIPSEWLFSGRIDKQIHLVLDEIKMAIQENELKAYFARVKRNRP